MTPAHYFINLRLFTLRQSQNTKTWKNICIQVCIPPDTYMYVSKEKGLIFSIYGASRGWAILQSQFLYLSKSTLYVFLLIAEQDTSLTVCNTVHQCLVCCKNLQVHYFFTRSCKSQDIAVQYMYLQCTCSCHTSLNLSSLLLGTQTSKDMYPSEY